MPKPSDYKYVRAWNKMMGSYEYHIRSQQRLAADDNAPLDALYKRHGTGVWVCASELDDERLKLVEKHLV
jgi:hypothetical protein